MIAKRSFTNRCKLRANLEFKFKIPYDPTAISLGYLYPENNLNSLEHAWNLIFFIKFIFMLQINSKINSNFCPDLIYFYTLHH